MAKITRILQKVFAKTSGLNQIGKFGSLAAGTPEYVLPANAEDIQDLANFELGWYGAVIGNNSPAIQDMNGLFHLAFRQLAYILQQGIAEYNAETEYTLNSYVMDSNGDIFRSIANLNTGNALTDGTKWQRFISNSVESVTENITLNNSSKSIFLVDNSSYGPLTITLPQASVSNGRVYKVKKVSTASFPVILDPNGSELIDGASNYFIETYLQSVTIVCDGIGWYIV